MANPTPPKLGPNRNAAPSASGSAGPVAPKLGGPAAPPLGPGGKSGGMLSHVPGAEASAAGGSDKKDGEGGGGFLSDAFHAVTGLGGGLGRVAIGLGKELAPHNPLAEFGKDRTGKTPGWHNVKEQMPITAELVTSPARTVREVPDTVGAVLPGGVGFGQSMLGKEIAEHGYLSTGLAKAADVTTIASLGAGALAKVGLGGLAEAARLESVASATSRAAGLGKVADALKLDEAAAAATKAGDAAKAADYARAADQVRAAQALRTTVAAGSRASQVGAKAAEVGRDVARFGGHIAGAPAKPYEFLGRGIGKVAGPVGEYAMAHSETAAKAAEAIGTALQRRRDIKAVRDIHYENVTAPEQAGQFRVREAGGVSDLSKNLEPTEQAALTIIRAKEGLDPAVREAFDLMTPEHQEALVRQMFGDQPVTVEAFQMAKSFEDGSLPAEQAARLSGATNTLNDAIYTEHGRRYVEGDATRHQLSEAGLAERRAQAEGGKPVPEKVARLTDEFQAPVKRRISAIDEEAEAIRQRNLDPQTGKLSDAAKRQVARDEGRVAVEKSIARQLRKREKDGAAAAERQAVRTGEKTANRADRLQREADRRIVRNDEKRLATLDERRAGYETKLDAAVKRAEDDVRAAPAQDRPALEVNKRAQTFVRDVAKEYPAEAERFAGLADDIATTTKELHAKGLHPEFTFGGKDVEKTSPVVGIGAKASRKKLSSEQARKSGALKRTVAGELESFERETHTILQNRVGAKIQESRLGSTAGKVLQDAGYSTAEIRSMTPAEMHAALTEVHAVPWQPTGTGGALKPEDVTASSAVVPDYVHKELTRYAIAKDKGATGYKLLKTYDKATGQIKHSVLALSPKWHVGNVMGNTIMAGIGAGVTPAKMVATLPEARRIVKAIKEGRLDDPGVVRLLSSGYHAEDLAQLRELAGEGNRLTNSKVGRGVSKVIRKSYALNETVDSIGRTLVYLAKKDAGVSSEAAVQMSLKAMGDFSRMTPVERGVIRRIVPFYAWQRHITKLAFSLPIEAPARVAWTLHLADLGDRINGAKGDDDPFNRNTIKVGGGRVNLNNFNPFGSSFFVDPSLQGAGYQTNPFLKAAVVGATGMSPNRGFKPLRTPEADFGDSAVGGFAARHPARFGQYLSQQIPQVKAAQNFAAGEQPVRFETGQVDKKHKTGRKTLAQIAQLLGIPIPTPEQKTR